MFLKRACGYHYKNVNSENALRAKLLILNFLVPKLPIYVERKGPSYNLVLLYLKIYLIC